MKWKMITLGVCTTALMAGCIGNSPEKKLFSMYESAAKKENDLNDIAKKRETLEKEGKALFQKVVDKGEETNKDVKDTIESYRKNTESRKKLLEKEYAILNDASKETEKAEVYVRKLEDKKQKEKAKKMVYTYEKRLDMYKEYKKHYEEALKRESDIQKQLEKEKTNLKEMSQHIQTVNASYQQAKKETGLFNLWSHHHNEGKVDFYEEVGIKVDAD